MKASHFYILFLVFGLYSIQLKAEERKIVNSKLTEATVFFKGAELTHKAVTNLTKGENELYIEGLSPGIDLNSLKIKSPNGVVVSSYEYTVDYLAGSKPSKAYLKNIEDSIKVCKDRIDKIEIDKKINTTILKYLQEGVSKNISGSEKGLGIDELVQTIDYFKSKSEEIETLLKALDNERIELEGTSTRLRSQLEQENIKGGTSSGILRINLSSSYVLNSTFTITYFTANAGWFPYFEINVESTEKPIKITQKSKVHQTTGLNWEKVKLTLSTGIPSNGKVAPLFSAWFLQQQYYAQETRVISSHAMQNSYSYSKPMKIGKEKVQTPLAVGNFRTLEEGELIYIIDGKQATREKFASIDTEMIRNMEVLKDDAAVDRYGSWASNGVIVVDLKDSMDDFVTESDEALNLVYNIDLPYSIPGNGKEQTIDLLVKETAADYTYYCAPKLDFETYLIAEISDWEKLGLLSGKANITYDGTYIGETFIDASSTKSKLTLTLGVDKRVVVKREKMKDFSSSKFLGSDVLQVFTYRLTVKNNRNKKIDMILKDQYPISTQKKIEVTLLEETTQWSANKEEVGVITWEEAFSAGETKTYMISYSVKYPKSMKLNL